MHRPPVLRVLPAGLELSCPEELAGLGGWLVARALAEGTAAAVEEKAEEADGNDMAVCIRAFQLDPMHASTCYSRALPALTFTNIDGTWSRKSTRCIRG